VALFAVRITYGDRAVRDQARPAHRAYLQELLDRGNLIQSGPFSDDSGALLIYEADSQAALQAILDKDPYWISGSLSDVEIKEWTIVFQRP
jgi:uncharacterized protein YciI